MEETEISSDKIVKKNDVLYYARIIPKSGLFDVYEIKVRTVGDDYFVGLEKRDKQAFLFYYKDIGNTIFTDRSMALDKVIEAEKNKRYVLSDETYYEEY